MDTIEIHAAPLQGITQYTWRNAHNAIFGGIDFFHSPFMRVEHGEIRNRDIADVIPENNTTSLVPQVIACNANEVAMLVNKLQDLGYDQIELNLGCPHIPLAKRHKGSGMLAFPDEIEQLCLYLSINTTSRYSVKMRLGWDNPTQWEDAIKALAPLSPQRITIHPRIGIQQYKGELYLDQFEALISECHYPIIYNGELKSLESVKLITNKYHNIAGIMIGRGLIANPAMLTPKLATAENYHRFHDEFFRSTSERITGGEHQVLAHMKAFWEYFLPNANKKLRKRILKSNSINQYIIDCNELFSKLNDIL